MAEEDRVMSLLQASLKASAPETWEDYIARAADQMRKFSQGEITLDACYASLPSKPSFVSAEVPEFIWDIVSEVHNPASGYRELLDLFESGATEEQIIEFINRVG